MSFKVSDWHLLTLELDLSMLGEHLAFVTEQLKHQREMQWNALQAQLLTMNFNLAEEAARAERDSYIQQHEYWAECVLPRIIVNPFIVALWALFETAIVEVAELVRKEKESPLGLEDIKGRHVVERAMKYYAHILDNPLDFSEDEVSRIEDLAALRNVIAHKGGRIQWLEKNFSERIKRGEIDDITTDGVAGHLLVGAHYARSAFELVSAVLRRLFDRFSSLRSAT